MGPIHQQLAADHERLARLLADSAPEPQGPIDLMRYRAYRGALLRHHSIEEKLLFPALTRARNGEPHPLHPALVAEHAALSALLAPTPTAAVLAALRAVLDQHERREEQPGGLYDAADQLLRGGAATLVKQMATVREPTHAMFIDSPDVYQQIARTMRAAGVAHPPPTR